MDKFHPNQVQFYIAHRKGYNIDSAGNTLLLRSICDITYNTPRYTLIMHICA